MGNNLNLKEQKMEKRKNVSMALIGETGVGKSLLGNRLVGREVFRVGHSAKSETTETTCADGSLFGLLDGQSISVLDSPGYNDHEGRDEVHNIQLINELKSRKKINGFLLVLNGSQPRLNRGTWMLLDLLDEQFPEFWENTVIIVNFWSNSEVDREKRKKFGLQEAERREDISNQLKSTYEMKKIPEIFFIDAAYVSKGHEEEFRDTAVQVIECLKNFQPYRTEDLLPKLIELDRVRAELDKTMEAQKEIMTRIGNEKTKDNLKKVISILPSLLGYGSVLPFLKLLGGFSGAITTMVILSILWKFFKDWNNSGLESDPLGLYTNKRAKRQNSQRPAVPSTISVKGVFEGLKRILV
eukprot:TRINITY_DN2354_c0_g1_i4.p1 TRINITY_DN2354_c0_g1~~TRINITY_DN2354_c0_g1_i4.p1  ORF type:complete len:387 (+),score=92.02 TRINITY_DN2354_c0_g1_i4:99-1163(+)